MFNNDIFDLIIISNPSSIIPVAGHNPSILADCVAPFNTLLGIVNLTILSRLYNIAQL
jgi:hypothetical protein